MTQGTAGAQSLEGCGQPAAHRDVSCESREALTLSPLGKVEGRFGPVGLFQQSNEICAVYGQQFQTTEAITS